MANEDYKSTEIDDDDYRLNQKFRSMAQEKTTASEKARKERERQTEEQIRNSIVARAIALKSGRPVEKDDMIDKELEILAFVKPEEYYKLAFDEDGHLCMKDDLLNRIPDASEIQPVPAEEQAPDSASENPETRNDEGSNEEIGALGIGMGAALREAYRATYGPKQEILSHLENMGLPDSDKTPVSPGTQPALTQLNTAVDFASGQEQELSMPGIDFVSKAERGGGETEIAFPQKQEEDDVGIPVDESVRVLRVEDIDFDEARIYLAVCHDTVMNESAYGALVEQSYGENRYSFVCGERSKNTDIKTAAYRAAIALLRRYSIMGQVVTNVTIFAPHEIGWMLTQNSWKVLTDSQNEDAALYSQTFRACTSSNIKIRIATTEALAPGQMIANEVAATLLAVPQ